LSPFTELEEIKQWRWKILFACYTKINGLTDF
jgi:hypothetical protein